MKTRETKFGTYIEMETKSNTEITGDKIRVEIFNNLCVLKFFI